MNDWLSVVAQCQECERVFAVAVPPTHDGSPLVCPFCGEMDAYLGAGDGSRTRQVAPGSIDYSGNVFRVTKEQRKPRKRKLG